MATAKEIIEQKINKANEARPIPLNVGYVNENALKAYWNDNTEQKQNFKKQVIDISETLKEKLQYLLAGKPLIIDHSTDEEIKDFIEDIDLQELVFQAIGVLFDKFNAYVVIEKYGDNRVMLRLADPNFPNTVFRMGKVPYKAEIWTAFKFERAQYWKLTTYESNKITNQVFTNKNGGDKFDKANQKQVNLKEINSKLPQELQIQPIEKGYGFLPIIHWQLKPSYDYSTSNNVVNKSFSDRLEPFQAMLNEATFNLRREGYLNRTKQFIDADLLNNEGQMETIADEGIIAIVSDSGDHKGDNKLFEIVQGDPKFEQYWLNVSNILSLAIKSLKLSELGEGDNASGSATEAIFNKGNDVETGNTLSTYYQKVISEICAKAYAVFKNESNLTETTLPRKDWQVQMLPNVIMNEAKMTEIVIQQLGAGLIDMVSAKSKLENISSADAKEALEKVGKDEYLNPTLASSSAFSEEDGAKEGDSKELPKGEGKSVVEQK